MGRKRMRVPIRAILHPASLAAIPKDARVYRSSGHSKPRALLLAVLDHPLAVAVLG